VITRIVIAIARLRIAALMFFTIIAGIVWATASTTGTPPAGATEAGTAAGDLTCRVREIWSLERDGDPPYSLFNPEMWSLPPTLMGVLIDETDNVYVADRITETLVKIAPGGGVVFQKGSLGEGPEDHRDQGEPILWPDCTVARSDCAATAKVIRYDAAGDFLDATEIAGSRNYVRILGTREFGVGISLDMNGTPVSGMQIDVYLETISPAGLPTDSLLLRSAKLPPAHPGEPLNETALEILPRVDVSDDGCIFVQRDPYVWKLERLDGELNLVWRCERDVEPRARAPEELERRRAVTMGLEPAPYEHVIRRLLPRSHGEVWVETPVDQPVPPGGTIILDRISPAGEYVGTVRLSGLPSAPGEFRTFGDRLLWKLDDDYEPTDVAAGEPPYLAIYAMETE
jgi:hypothetical protein